MKNLLLLLFCLTLVGLCSLTETKEAQAQTVRPPIMPIIIVKDIIRDDKGDTNNPHLPANYDHWQVEVRRDSEGRTRTSWRDADGHEEKFVIIDIPTTGQRYIINDATHTYTTFNLTPAPTRSAPVTQTINWNRIDYGMETAPETAMQGYHSSYEIQATYNYYVQVWRSDSMQTNVRLEVTCSETQSTYTEVVKSYISPDPSQIGLDQFSVPAGYSQVSIFHASIADKMNTKERSLRDPVLVNSYGMNDSYSMITRIPGGMGLTFSGDAANAVASFNASARTALLPKVSQWHFVDIFPLGTSTQRKVSFGEATFNLSDANNPNQPYFLRRLIIFESPEAGQLQ